MHLLDLPRMLWNIFVCQLFIGAFNYSLNLISLNLNSGNMTDHLSSSPALTGAASKPVEAFFHPRKIKKRQNILCFFFFFLITEKQKRRGPKCSSQAKININRFAR